MTTDKITFIGAGNMAYSLIGGLINNAYPADSITAIDMNQGQLDKLSKAFAINTLVGPDDSIRDSDCLIFAVKPQVMRDVIAQYQRYLSLQDTLFISIAAGISVTSLEKWLSPQAAIVRCMPNTPALVQAGATVLYANSHVSDAQKNLANDILSAVGLCTWTS